jgi:biopolymer transport protein ExbB
VRDYLLARLSSAVVGVFARVSEERTMLTGLFLKLTYVGAEWVLWILVVLSIVSIALIVERSLYFLRTRAVTDELAARLHEELRAGKVQNAWQLVKDSHTYCIESAVVAAGLVSLRNGAQAASETMQSVKARMRPQLDANLSILATIGSNAPFIGLLGTVLGIIKTAHELTPDAAQSSPNAVMAGVFEALVATAVGLFVAIPAVVAYNLFQRRVRKRMAEVDSLAHLILAMLRYEPRTPTHAPNGAATKVA